MATDEKINPTKPVRIESLYVWECRHCNEEWRSQSAEPPTYCGVCKSPNWQRPKHEGIGRPRKEGG